MKKILLLLFLLLSILFLVSCADITNSQPKDNDEQIQTYIVKTYSNSDEYGNAGTFTEVNQIYSTGEQVVLIATVNDGYNFEGWFIDEICVSKDLTYKTTVKSSNLNIEARYNYYTVTTISYTNDYETAGTYSKLQNKKISVGNQVTVTATVNDGYNFEGWFINDICINNELTYTYVMKNYNVELEAKWSYYTVTINSYTDEQGNAGTYTQKNNDKISAGDIVTLTATVSDGYNFEGWYIDNICVCPELTYQFIMDKTNKIINVKYSYYTLTTDGYLWKWSYTENLENTAGTYTKYTDKKNGR